MYLEENLTEKEFNSFRNKNKYSHAYQSVFWGKFKSSMHWKFKLLGLKGSKKELVGVAMVLIRKVPGLNKNFIYIPRGFLLDYSKLEYVESFTELIKEYAKKNNAFLVTIDPAIVEKHYDREGTVLEYSDKATKLIETLLKSGYNKSSSERSDGSFNEIQPRYSFFIDIEKPIDDILADLHRKTRYEIKASSQKGLVLEKGSKEDLVTFTELSNFTAKRNGFMGRNLNYFEKIWDNLKEEHLDLHFVYFDVKEGLKILKNNLRNSKAKDTTRLEREISEVKEYEEKGIKKVLLAGALFLKDKDTVWYLYAATNDELRHTSPSYFLQWEVIKKYQKEGYKKYDLRGGIPNKKSPMYGLYTFKKRFSKGFVSYIGEYDLVINKKYYFAWKFLLPKIKKTIKFIKKLKK